jgi:hypothetical protein
LSQSSYFKFISTYYAYLFVTSVDNNKEIEFTGYFYNGNTDFTWFFFKTGSGIDVGKRISDYVEITKLSITYFTRQSGGIKCDTCYAGSYAAEGDSQCKVCPRGYYSESGSTECTACLPDQYTLYEGSTECTTCGNNTYPNVCPENPDDPTPANDCTPQTKCEFNNCGFVHNESFVFDLSPIQTNNAMINPKQPSGDNYTYYVNLCTRNNSMSTCLDYFDSENGGDDCYACLQTPGTYYYSYRIGTKGEINYFEDQTTGEYGVNITYSDGDYMYCNQSAIYGPRQLEIHLLCVGDYGVGTLIPSEPFQNEKCTYRFDWTTEYACRLCTLDDYQLLSGDCVKGKRNQTYVLRTDISTCMHGISKFY